MLGAPLSRSAHARRGAGGARRLQAPTPVGVTALSIGAGCGVRPSPPRSGAARDRLRATTRADRGQPPVGDPAAADFRGRPARVPDLPRPHADRRVHHPGVGDRPDPHPPPRPRGPRRRAEPPIDAGPREPGRVTRPARPPTPRPPPEHGPDAPPPRGDALAWAAVPPARQIRSPPASPPHGDGRSRRSRRPSEREGTATPVTRRWRDGRSRHVLD